MEINIGDRVVCLPEGIKGTVIYQYYPTAIKDLSECCQQTMIRTDNGRRYHAPTKCFIRI